MSDKVDGKYLGNPEVLKQLGELKLLTKASGMLYEAQVLQLKYWPYVLFPITNHTIIPDDRKRVIVFNIRLTGKKGQATLKEHCMVLEKWVQELLGGEFMIKVRDMRNDKWLYVGSRAVAFEPPPLTGEEVELDDEYPMEEESDAT